MISLFLGQLSLVSHGLLSLCQISWLIGLIKFPGKKLNYAKPGSHILGVILEGETRVLGKDRTHPILTFPLLPQTLKQLRAFLGEMGYCNFGSQDMQTWCLYHVFKEAQILSQFLTEWHDKAENAFQQLKRPLDGLQP
jgi:hypothetical protein